MAGFSDLRSKVDAMRRAVANLNPVFAVLEQEGGETAEDFDRRVALWRAAAIESTGREPSMFLIRDAQEPQKADGGRRSITYTQPDRNHGEK